MSPIPKADASFVPPPPDLPMTGESAASDIKPAVGYHPPDVPKKREPEPVDAHPPELSPDVPLSKWVPGVLKDAFAYPWRRNGWAILVPGGILALLLSIGTLAPLLGIVALVFAVGYFGAFYFDIIATTISDREYPPDWPELSSFLDDIIRPAFQIFGVTILSFLPLWLHQWSQGERHQEGMLDVVLWLLGSAYHPMACIAIVMNGSLFVAMPQQVIPAIWRCLPAYLLTVGILLLATGVSWLAASLFEALPMLISFVLSSLLSFFSMMVQARITGLTARRFRDRISWG